MDDKLVLNHFEQHLRWPAGGASTESYYPDEYTQASYSVHMCS
ncbi:Uncharacterised protein [Yersinia aldovae]|nr:Uncharacterised protein [Yersinia aldovae]